MDLNDLIFPAPFSIENHGFGIENNLVWIPVSKNTRTDPIPRTQSGFEEFSFSPGFTKSEETKRKDPFPRKKRRRIENSFDEKCEVQPGEEFDSEATKQEANSFIVSGSCTLQKNKPDLRPVGPIKKRNDEENEMFIEKDLEYFQSRTQNGTEGDFSPVFGESRKVRATQTAKNQVGAGVSLKLERLQSLKKQTTSEETPIPKANAKEHQDSSIQAARPNNHELSSFKDISRGENQGNYGIGFPKRHEFVQPEMKIQRDFSPFLKRNHGPKAKLRSVSSLKLENESTHHVPCLLLKPGDHPCESVLIMLHANAEDIFQAYKIASLMQTYLKVKTPK